MYFLHSSSVQFVGFVWIFLCVFIYLFIYCIFLSDLLFQSLFPNSFFAHSVCVRNIFFGPRTYACRSSELTPHRRHVIYLQITMVATCISYIFMSLFEHVELTSLKCSSIRNGSRIFEAGPHTHTPKSQSWLAEIEICA